MKSNIFNHHSNNITDILNLMADFNVNFEEHATSSYLVKSIHKILYFYQRTVFEFMFKKMQQNH